MSKAEKTAIASVFVDGGVAAFLIVYVVTTHDNVLGIWAVLASIRTVAAIFVVLGMRLSERHTKTFPMGLYKLENLGQTLVGVAIMVLAYEVGRMAIKEFSKAATVPKHATASIIILIVSAVIAGLAALYKSRVWKQERSPSLQADARYSFADFVVLTAYAIGIGLESAGVAHASSVARLVAVLYMFYMGGKLALDGLKVLLDASVGRGDLDRVRKAALEHPLVKDVPDVSGRNSGSFEFINVTVLIVTADLRAANHIASEVEVNIHKEVPGVDRVTVEFVVEPKGKMLCAVPTGGAGGAIAADLTAAPSFELLEVTVPGGEITSRDTIHEPVPAGKQDLGVRVAVTLALRGVDAVFTNAPPSDEETLAAFDAYAVELVSQPDAKDVAAAEAALVEYAKGMHQKRGDEEAERGDAA